MENTVSQYWYEIPESHKMVKRPESVPFEEPEISRLDYRPDHKYGINSKRQQQKTDSGKISVLLLHLTRFNFIIHLSHSRCATINISFCFLKPGRSLKGNRPESFRNSTSFYLDSAAIAFSSISAACLGVFVFARRP